MIGILYMYTTASLSAPETRSTHSGRSIAFVAHLHAAAAVVSGDES